MRHNVWNIRIKFCAVEFGAAGKLVEPRIVRWEHWFGKQCRKRNFEWLQFRRIRGERRHVFQRFQWWVIKRRIVIRRQRRQRWFFRWQRRNWKHRRHC
jgi:hypothetical protein